MIVVELEEEGGEFESLSYEGDGGGGERGGGGVE